MPYVLPVAEIYLQPFVTLTLTFDLLTPLVDHVMALPVDHLYQLASNCFTIFETLCSKVWWQTNRQTENIGAATKTHVLHTYLLHAWTIEEVRWHKKIDVWHCKIVSACLQKYFDVFYAQKLQQKSSQCMRIAEVLSNESTDTKNYLHIQIDHTRYNLASYTSISLI